MKRQSKRAVWLGAFTFVVFLALGGTAALAAEGAAGGWYWQNPLTQGNPLLDVAVVGDHVVTVGTGGTVFTSDDRGASWTRRASGARGNRLQSVVFVNGATGWAAGNGGIIKTTDGGVTWRGQSVPGAGVYDYSSVSFVDADHGWACGSYSVNGALMACRVVRTADGGSHWEVAAQWTSSSGAAKGDVQFLSQVDFVTATTGWATGWGCFDRATNDWSYVLLKTTDAGDSWTVSRLGTGAAALTAMDFTSLSDGWLASAAIDGYVPATIYRTTDGGATWAPVKTREGSTISDLSASLGGECFAAGAAEGLSDWKGFILHSTDAGSTWTEEYAQDSLKPNAVAFSTTAAVAVGDGGLRLSRSANGTWAEYRPGVRKNLTNVQFWDTKLGWAVGWKSTVLRTTDGGKTWTAASVPSGISLEGIDMVSKKTGWAVGCSGPHVPYADMDAGYGAVVLKTTDGGIHWKFQLNRTTKPGLAGVDFSDTKHGVAVGTSGLTARTDDGGKTWWLRTVGSETLRDVKFLDASNGVAVGGDTDTRQGSGSIWQTTDGGATWTQVTLPQDNAHVAPIRALFKSESASVGSSLTAVGDRSQIYTSADGATWTFQDMTPAIVMQDPPYMHGMDIGLTSLTSPWLVPEDDAIGWVLGDDGAIWTKPATASGGLPWVLPPTVSTFTPESGAGVGATVTIFGSGFKPKVPGDSRAIGWVEVTAGGSGYASAPVVTIEPPAAGVQASGTANIDASGAVTSITLTDPGSGYTAGTHVVTIAAPPAGGVQATAMAVTASSTVVSFGGAIAVPGPDDLTDTQVTVTVPDGAKTARIVVSTAMGSGSSLTRFEVPGSSKVVDSCLLNHAGGSGQDNQLNGLAVVDWVDAWAVGERGSILSFDRMPPQTTISPSNGWVKSPSLTLSSTDAKSGVHTYRWVVDPDGIDADVHPPIGDWDTWDWQTGETVTFNPTGDPPGHAHVIYYQAIDNVGNVELDPFWLRYAYDSSLDRALYEAPRHIWVTLDQLGPQTYAPKAVTVKRNSKPAFDFWVNDDLSEKAKVTIVVKNGAGTAVKSLSLGWLPTWREFSAPISDWKCTLAKGTYTFEVRAVDQAGNSQIEPAGHNTFTVN